MRPDDINIESFFPEQTQKFIERIATFKGTLPKDTKGEIICRGLVSKEITKQGESNRSFELVLEGGVGVPKIFQYFGIQGFTSGDVIEKLDEMNLKSGDTLIVPINSPGGDSFQGQSIFNKLRREVERGVDVQIEVDGMAASAASIIAMGGTNKPLMRTGTQLMIHEAGGSTRVNKSNIDKIKDFLIGVDNDSTDTYLTHNDVMSRSELDKAIIEETWYSATQAVESGFARKADGNSATDSTVTNAVEMEVDNAALLNVELELSNVNLKSIGDQNA